MLTNNSPFLIAETAFHHEGNSAYLKELILAALSVPVDAIKFHLLFDLNDYFVPDHSAFEALKKLIIPKEAWEDVHRVMAESGIKPIYLCNDVESLAWVNRLSGESVLAVEIHATGINDIFLLEEAAKFANTVMLGSGGSSINDLSYAISFLKARGKTDILLMHGFQNYPTNYQDVVFSRMLLLKQTFGLPVGYADHSDPLDPLNAYISCLPQAFGFNILEKHFTISPGEKRVDGQSAVSINDLVKIRALQKDLFAAHGIDPFKMSPAEMKYGDTGPMKKAIVSSRPLKKGELLSLSDFRFKRTNSSVSLKQSDIHLLLNGEVLFDIQENTPLTFECVKYQFKTGDTSQFFVK